MNPGNKMLTAHSPEPWHAGARTPGIRGERDPADCAIFDAEGFRCASGEEMRPIVPDVALRRKRLNAARIVACVNACAGINPEAVPDMLGILDAIVLGNGMLTRAMLDSARAAVRKAKG